MVPMIKPNPQCAVMTPDALKQPMLNSQWLGDFMEKFVGYGNFSAPYWYVGMEEGGDSTDESLTRRLSVWQKRGRSSLEDLREYHLCTGLEEFFGPSAKLQTTWKQLIRITFSAEARPCDPEEMREYQAQKLGRRHGETALLELYPLPATSLSHWPYGSLSDLPLLRDRKTYHRDLASMRIQLIQRLVDEHQPRFVVMYGTTYRKLWERIHGGRLDQYRGLGVYRGKRGHTELILVKHPAAKGVTNEYFESVGRCLRDFRASVALG
jgi:hypothetical protein